MKAVKMLAKILFVLLITLRLCAEETLQEVYFTDSYDINISSIVKDVQNDTLLFSMEPGKYTKRLKSEKVLKLLKKHGFDSYTAKSRYIKFEKKSPIELSKIKQSIVKYYTQKYKTLVIKKINIMPRSYIESLPDDYVVHIPRNRHLSNKATLYIKTLNNRKIFFDYEILADLTIYMTKTKIKRDVEFSPMNTVKKRVLLEKFRAMPIEDLADRQLQSKVNMRKNRIITVRDAEGLSLIKRNNIVSVSLNNKNIYITFTAKALQDGKLNDIITVQKSDGKRIRVRVTAHNKAEVK